MREAAGESEMPGLVITNIFITDTVIANVVYAQAVREAAGAAEMPDPGDVVDARELVEGDSCV